ncbi:MAG: hypothetical protein ACOVOC_10800 [Rhabdaerophilum sp.]
MMVIAKATRMAGLAGLLAAMAGFATTEASAQFYPRPFFYGGYYSGPIVVPVPRHPVGVSVGDIFEDLRDRGYRSLILSGRRPDVLVVDAIDRNRQPVRLIVDAHDGEVLERFQRDAGTPAPRGTAALNPDPRFPREGAPRSRTEPSSGQAANPLPPRRPDAVAQLPGSGAATSRPAPVAPARDPSLWAPQGPAAGTQ